MVGDERRAGFLDEPIHRPKQHVRAEQAGHRLDDARVVRQVPSPGVGDGQGLAGGANLAARCAGFGGLEAAAQGARFGRREHGQRKQESIAPEGGRLRFGQLRHAPAPNLTRPAARFIATPKGQMRDRAPAA